MHMQFTYRFLYFSIVLLLSIFFPYANVLNMLNLDS